jgi:hypothetical protein
MLGKLSEDWKGKAVKWSWLALGVGKVDDKAGGGILEAKYKDPR